MSAVDSLEENSKEVFETAVRLLVTVADNILNNPNDIKFRRLKLANKNVSEKLLPAIGAIECLFEMGFDEVFIFYHCQVLKNEKYSIIYCFISTYIKSDHKNSREMTVLSWRCLCR
jgi:hypothetical protein